MDAGDRFARFHFYRWAFEMNAFFLQTLVSWKVFSGVEGFFNGL
jgi:hypothetical protein